MTINQKLQMISHENIYCMMMYVYSDLYDETLEKQEDFYEQLDDMMADILMSGIVRQLKRGLYKEYVRQEEASLMIRGKIDMNESIRLKTQQSQKLFCAYDVFDQDNVYNQILKATCLHILRQGRVSRERRKRLKDLLLSFRDIREIPLRTITWENIRFHKDKFAYRSLIGLCHMIYNGLAIDEETEQTYLPSIVMADLYERFIQYFYLKEWPQIHQSFQGKFNTRTNTVAYIKNMLTVDMLLTYKRYRLIVNTHYFDNLFDTEITHEQKQFLEKQVERLFRTIDRNNFNLQGIVGGYVLYPSLAKTYVEQYEQPRQKIYLGNIDLTGPFEEIKGILMDIGEDVIKTGARR